MNLQIRDPRAHDLARKLAEKRNMSMTEVVIDALEAELRRENEAKPRAGRLAATAKPPSAYPRQGGRDINKDEIDPLWGYT